MSRSPHGFLGNREYHIKVLRETSIKICKKSHILRERRRRIFRFVKQGKMEKEKTR